MEASGEQPEGPTESSSVSSVELTLRHEAHSVTVERSLGTGGRGLHWRAVPQSPGAELDESHANQFPLDPGECGTDGDRKRP